MKTSRNLFILFFFVLAGLLLPVASLSAGTKVYQSSKANVIFTVTGTTPAAGSLAVSPGSNVSAIFNKSLNQASVTGDTFVIHGSQTGTYDGVIAFPAANSTSFDPQADFKAGEIIQATAARGILSDVADPLDPPSVWQFEVAAGTASGFGTGILDPNPQGSDGWESGHVALGDLDGDGDLDAFVGSEVWFGQGNGQFVKSAQDLSEHSWGPTPSLGDMDGDGDLDAVLSYDSGQNKLWFNDGVGTFTASQGSLGSSASAVAIGDVNLDGYLDLFIANYISGDIWINDGQGGFTASGQKLSEVIVPQSFLRDFDGDGALDLLLSGPFKPELFLNDGSGKFSLSPHVLPPPDDLEAVGVGDLDADGDLDVLLFSNYKGHLWRNNGTGKFSQHLAFSEGYPFSALALGDLDGDGDLDTILSSSEKSRVWLNNGQGTFDKGSQLIGHGAFDLKLGDLDGDGDLDVLFGESSKGARAVYFNRDKEIPPKFRVEATQPAANDVAAPAGDPLIATLNKPPLAPSLTDDAVRLWGEFGGEYEKKITPSGKQVTTQAEEDFKPGERITAVLTTAVQSVDGDPLNDGLWQFTAAASSGTGHFYPSTQSFNWTTRSRSMFFDLDGDSDLDMLTLFCDGETKSMIHLNDGRGQFTVSQRLQVRCSVQAAAGDLDGDGHPDLVIAGSGIWFNDGSGTFNLDVQELPSAADVALGDVEADGDLDIILATDKPKEIWLNDGRGNFSNSGQAIGYFGDHMIQMGDLDIDGDLDLILDGEITSTTWFNDGRGHYDQGVDSLLEHVTNVIASGDVDADGDLDLFAVSSNGSYATHLWLNDGHGAFSKKQKLISRASLGALGDIDADGDLDFLFVSHETTWAHINDGKGNFSQTSSAVAPWPGSQIVLGDVDSDGDLDFLLSNGEDNQSRILLNYGQQILLPVVASSRTWPVVTAD